MDGYTIHTMPCGNREIWLEVLTGTHAGEPVCIVDAAIMEKRGSDCYVEKSLVSAGPFPLDTLVSELVLE